MSAGLNLLGLSLSTLDAKFSDVELGAAPPVWPVDVRIPLPAQLHDHQVSDVRVGGDEEGLSGVTVQGWSARLRQEKLLRFEGSLHGLLDLSTFSCNLHAHVFANVVLKLYK